MRVFFAGAIAATLLAGCAAGPAIVVRGPTAVEITATPDRRQQVEDAAAAYCGAKHLSARLSGSPYRASQYETFAVVYGYRYECVATPQT